MNSIIHQKFEGTLVLISGLHGLGKTTLAATMEAPAKTAMIDFDLKGQSLARALNMAWYRSPDHTRSTDDYNVKELAAWFFKALTDIPAGITHLIIDNATWAEAGLGYRVLQDPAKYGVNAKNAQAGVYGGVNPGVTVLWSNIVTYLQGKGIKTITAINHMSQPWVNGAPAPNRFNVKGNKVFNQIASLALILVPGNPDRGGRPPAPSALVIKEALSVTKFDEATGEFTIARAIPARIPVCTWKRINGYFDQPASFATPAPGEMWDKNEVNAYSEWLSPEQIEWVLKVRSYTEDDQAQAQVLETSPAPVASTPQPVKPDSRPITPVKSNGNSEIGSPAKLLEAVNREVGGYYKNAPHMFNALNQEIEGFGWPAPKDTDGWDAAHKAAVDHFMKQKPGDNSEMLPGMEPTAAGHYQSGGR